MSNRNTNAYENVRDQIGFCGIWCGSCVVGNGTLKTLTEKYKEMITAYRLLEWAPKDFDHTEFSHGLTSIQRNPVCPGCLKGGGRKECEIRRCASERGLTDCTLCDEFGECEHRNIIDKMRSGALAAGLFVKALGTDNQELIRDWSHRLERRWPCCILFDEQT
jgi:hypothetical protein